MHKNSCLDNEVQEIAQLSGLSVLEVGYHLKNVAAKLGFNTVEEMYQQIQRIELITGEDDNKVGAGLASASIKRTMKDISGGY